MVGDGSATGSTSADNGNSGDKYTINAELINSVTGTPVKKGNELCHSFVYTYDITCDPGGDDNCKSGTDVVRGESCFTPN